VHQAAKAIGIENNTDLEIGDPKRFGPVSTVIAGDQQDRLGGGLGGEPKNTGRTGGRVEKTESCRFEELAWEHHGEWAPSSPAICAGQEPHILTSIDALGLCPTPHQLKKSTRPTHTGRPPGATTIQTPKNIVAGVEGRRGREHLSWALGMNGQASNSLVRECRRAIGKGAPCVIGYKKTVGRLKQPTAIHGIDHGNIDQPGARCDGILAKPAHPVAVIGKDSLIVRERPDLCIRGKDKSCDLGASTMS